MADEYSQFFVSNKIAIYSHDLRTVMVMQYYPRDICGLPGGHLDPGETPESAIARELKEELDVLVDGIQKVDFFVRNPEEVNSTVILAYTAIAPEGFKTNPTRPESEYDLWVTREEVPSVNMAESYKKFVLENWPN